jgi:UDP-GlcNAc3NAcA epimerase
MKIVTIIGARPQFIKAATVSRLIKSNYPKIEEVIVHTGQHYDENMSAVFFDELCIPQPSINLDIGSSLHGEQTGKMMCALERVLINESPDWVLIYGDTNSTLAGALVSSKLNIAVAHVEAGLRSFNRGMPEEINRIVADQLSTLLFCPSSTAVHNLEREGICKGVQNVGDVMCDSIYFNRDLSDKKSNILSEMDLTDNPYCLLTIHRAENTDKKYRFHRICESLKSLPLPVVWPVHPRARKLLSDDFLGRDQNVKLIDPVSYLDMIALEKHAQLILTDSGGVQKEAYWLGVPCLTLRKETEWTELVAMGVNRLVDVDKDNIVVKVKTALSASENICFDVGRKIYGDGFSANRIIQSILEHKMPA